MTPRQSGPAPSVVLTGGGGWFGSTYLASLVDSGVDPTTLRVLVGSADEVVTVTDLAPGAQVHVGDIADATTVRRLLHGATGADVVHAAGTIHPARVADFERVNVTGTVNVVAEAERAGVRRLVHISSNSPFGVNPRRDDTFRADEPYQPYLGYGRSKMRAEQCVVAAHERGVVETVILRPAWFYGPWQPPRQSRFFTMVRQGRFPIVGDGRQRRSMTYTPSLAAAVERSRSLPAAAGARLWVADTTPLTLNDIVATVREALVAEGLPVRGRPRHVPAVVGRLAEAGDRLLQSRGVYVQELHVLGELDKTIACDTSRTTEALGLADDHTLLDGMRTSIRWCLEHGTGL